MAQSRKKHSSIKPLRPAGAPRQIVLRASISDITPAIWRVVRVPEEYTLHQLHHVLQFVFGWLDYHLYEFRVADRLFEGPHPDSQGPTTVDVTLAELKLKSKDRFQYLYDFGDDWLHVLEVVGFLPMPDASEMDWSPRLIDGARNGPPEDAGGPPGYERVIAAFRDPSDPEHATYTAWLGDGYDPERFDLRALDRALALAAGWGAI